jgi:hypothetical protein
MSDEKQLAMPAIPSEIAIHFVKSSAFRVAQANGVWFGTDPQGNLHLTFYSERSPIPKKMVLKLDENGQPIGEDESQRDVKTGVLREMEIDIVMSVSAALAFYEMLGQNLKTASNNLEVMQAHRAL